MDDGDDHGEDDHHRTSLGLAIGLNTIINAVINAAFGYGIAWLHWQDYTLSWYGHELHGLFELDFVVEDLIVQGISVGIIVTLIVAAILHRQWDGDHLEPGTMDRFLIGEERSRGRHMLSWAGGMALMGFTVSIGIVALIASGPGEIEGATFALARTVNGFVVGGIAGGFVTASWVTNLTAGNLVTPDGPDTVVARTMTRASQRPWVVLAAIALVTTGLGVGVTDINVNVNESDAMPRSTDDHEGALAVEESFNGTRELAFEWHFRTDPQSCRADNDRQLTMRPASEAACGNISDEVYLRAMEEAFTFLEEFSYEVEDGAFVEDLEEQAAVDTDEDKQRIYSPVEAQHGLPSFVKLANWTIAGGQGQAPEDAYGLPAPQDRPRTDAAIQLAWDRLGQAQQATIDGDAEQAVASYHVDPETELTSRQIGNLSLEARDAYVEWAQREGTWQVFTGDNEPQVAADRPVANAHHAAQLDDDLGAILGVLGAGLLVGTAIVFRDPLAATVATATVAIAGLWTFGLLGITDVPLSELDLVHAPLVLAAGVVFTVPTIETILEKAEDTDIRRAVAETGDEVVFGLSIGAYVAAAGLVTLGLSPMALAADAAWTASFGIASAFLLTITLVPAALGLVGASGRMVSFEEAGGGGPGERSLSSRGIAAAVVVALTVASAAGVAGLSPEAWGEARQTWPAEDEVRKEHEQAVLGFHDLDEGADTYASDAIVVQGDVTHPGALAYMERLTTELEDEAGGNGTMRVSTTRDLPSVIRDWQEVCCGAQGLAQSDLANTLGDQGDDADPYPTTQAEVQATLEDMLGSPYAPIVSPLIAQPDGEAVVIDLSLQQGDAATATQGWQTAQRAIDAAEADRPNDVRTSLTGSTATAHLTSEDQVPWLVYMLVAGTAMAGVLALGYTRELTGTLMLTIVVGVASTWLLGLLSIMDVAFTVATSAGLATGLLVAAGLGARHAWPPSRGAGHARAGLFSVVLLVGLLAGLAALLDTSAGFPSLIAEDAIQVMVAATGSAYVAQGLVARALVRGEVAEEPENAGPRVVEAGEAESA